MSKGLSSEKESPTHPVLDPYFFNTHVEFRTPKRPNWVSKGERKQLNQHPPRKLKRETIAQLPTLPPPPSHPPRPRPGHAQVAETTGLEGGVVEGGGGG